MPSSFRVVLVCAGLLSWVAGCGGDGDGGDGGGPPDAGAGPRDFASMEAPTSTVPEAGIRRELVLIDGVSPPANPVTGETSPAPYNRTRVVRYRQDVEPSAPVRAVVIAYPGFLGGAASFELLARHLIRRGADTGVALEVWAIDRRANLLEHTIGLDTAEVAGDPEIAQGYYNGRDTIDGVAFPGFALQQDVSFMSEWGLATHVEDLRRVIAAVPADARRGRVFLMGHSLGASFAEAYAAWRFADGTRGDEELAGVILVDGVLGSEPIAERDYLEGSGGGLIAQVGIDELRADGPRYFELPIFGVQILPGVEILSLRVLHDPDGVIEDEIRDGALRVQLSLGSTPVPAMTNAAALGFGLDDGSDAISITAVSCGEPTGGPVEEYENAIAMKTLVRPTDPDATYAWIGATENTPGELTRLEDLAFSFTHGATNFAEWYFPTRLPADLAAVGGARVPEDGYQAAAGLRAFDGALIDAPILAIATDLATPDEYEAVRARVAPAIGEGRPAAGTPRDAAAAFRVIDAPALTHVDPLTAMDREDNPVPAAVFEFVREHAAAGELAIELE